MNTTDPIEPTEPLVTDSQHAAPRADQPGAQPVAQPTTTGPRTGPIVWGAIVLLICAYMALQIIAPGGIDTVTFMIASMIGLGLLLLAVGIVVVVRGARRR